MKDLVLFLMISLQLGGVKKSLMLHVLLSLLLVMIPVVSKLESDDAS